MPRLAIKAKDLFRPPPPDLRKIVFARGENEMAGWTGLEPAAFCVTGRRSNQLSYHPVPERRANVECEHTKSSA